jgi:hypothetical protein
MNALEMYDEIAHADAIVGRLVETALRIQTAEERGWLETAAARLRTTIDLSVLERSLRLPELRALHGDLSKKFQGEAVDAVDGLLAALTKLNERSPLIEVLFRNLKPIAMRRAKNDDFEDFLREIEKRMTSGYGARMLGDQSYQPLTPALDQLARASAEWRESLHPTALDPEEDRSLREALETTRSKIALPMKQALFLAEAALADHPELREESRIFERPRRRPAPRRAFADQPS